MYKHKSSNGKEYIVTEKDIMLWEMAQRINFWLMDQGDDTSKYHIRLDLCCDIKQELEKALDKTAEIIQKAIDEGKWIQDSNNSEK